jgi:UDP-N-acetylmuramate--alanine ligase
MSGMAMLLSEYGAVVSGSDAAQSLVFDDLRARRVTTFEGHDARYVHGAEIVLWSPAVSFDNVELAAAREAGARLVPRASAFEELSSLKRVVGFTGTHGKTTATSMMVQVSLAAGRDDAWLLGAPVLGVGAQGHWGEGDLLLEIDESYGTFGELHPYALGITNVEPDHLDFYGTLEALESAFADLVARTSGPVVAWSDDPGARRVVASRPDVVLVGSDDDAMWRVGNVALARRGATFTLSGPSALEIELRVTGALNVANASVVAVLAHEVGIADEAIVRGLSNFMGAPRRYQYRGVWRGADVYEDYAHLPGEISATIAATQAAGYERITVVFQPHRVTRTIALVDQFTPAFSGARHVIVTDVYHAGEANPSGVTGELIANALLRFDPTLDTLYCADLALVGELLGHLVDDSDVILVLGAGDVGSIIAGLPGGLS